MTFERIGHTYQYETENICRLFFPFEPLEKKDGNISIYSQLAREPGGARLIADVTVYGKHERVERFAKQESDWERELCVALFLALTAVTGRRPPWGAQTGVRPVKYLGRLTRALGAEKADAFFQNQLLVTPAKIELCRRVLKTQGPMMARLAPERFSLYVSIPFCPTRCSYCSFVSHSMDKARKLIPDYVKLLCEEIKLTGELAARQKMTLDTVYFGGGTPTVLEAEELRQLMEVVASSFPDSRLVEYTVEAGRPDTVTEEKLDCLKENGCTRISVNPQTFDDRVLKAIGRLHTGQMAVDAFWLARNKGFSCINMDLIAGLPGDTAEGFAKTVQTALELGPENITVHTLSAKRASRMTYRGEHPVEGCAGVMLEQSQNALTKQGYEPYYLYRQSRQTENLENTGWCLPGMEGYYNVYIMDECQTILACGAGASTKLVLGENQIKRVFNFKFPYEYIDQFGEIQRRKKEAFQILAEAE